MDVNARSVLVTGGLGAIGSCFVKVLVARGAKVTVIDACETARNVWALEQLRYLASVRIVVARLEKMHGLDEMVRAADLVIHAAASTGIPHSAADPMDDWRSNVDASICLLEALRGAKRPTVMLSSVKPYGLAEPDYASYMREDATRWTIADGVGIDEKAPLEPDEPYAASKASQSMAALAWARSYDLPVTVLRCSNLYGPGAPHGPRHGWLTWFCLSAAIGRPIEVQGSGKQTRDMLFHADLLDAVLKLAANLDRVEVRGQVFNIGGGPENTISVLEAAQECARAYGADVIYAPEKARKHEDMLFVTDTAKLRSVIDWRACGTVREGMDAIYNWAKENAKDLRALYEGA